MRKAAALGKPMPSWPAGPATAGRALWYLLAVLLIAADQVTKHLASSQLIYGEPVAVTSFFDLCLLHNKGAAFSFLSQAGGWQQWLFGAVAAIVSLVLVVWIYRLPAAATRLGLGLALVLGGALGNLWDRLTLGHVVDFIHLHYQGYYWPAFNLADSAITLGAALLILDNLFGGAGGRRDG